MDWIDLAQDRNQWRALVNTAMNLRVFLYLVCVAIGTAGLLYQPWMIGDGDCGENWWNEDWQRKPKYSEKILPQRHFVHHISHVTRPGFEPEPPLWEASD
jgi:hypothetical protein